MKKHFYIVLFLFAIGKLATAQDVPKYWMGDTSKVHIMYDTINNAVADTDAFPRYSVERGSVYWDKELKHKYSICYPSSKYYADTTWYNNGQISRVLKIIGERGMNSNGYTINGWYRDGRKKVETIFKGNKEVITYYYESGNVKEVETYVKHYSTPDTGRYYWVYVEKWCDNGTKTCCNDSLSWHGLHAHLEKVYYCNGNVQAEFWRFNGYCFGTLKRYYENGKLQSVEERDDTSYIYSLYHVPRKQGKWIYYNEEGKPIKQEKYKDDVLIDAKMIKVR